uniref:Protein kinase domain-containing protein n=1 Tax=Panagrolaimus sp. ES5 TaxID=591445 RepID=A0AC34F0P3_9BILA
MAQNFHYKKTPTRIARQNFHHQNQNISKLHLNYKFLKQLGQGAFSTVYLAEHKNRQSVALKQIRTDSLDEKYYDLCKKEVNLLNQIQSINVVKCYETFVEKNYIYVSLEYADAGDLENLIKKMQSKGRLLSERSIWYYFHQICNGLNDMHDKRILHRDLKPANVFLNSRGHVKIGDLGLSRIFSAQTMLAQTRVGTEYYMAPERNNMGGYNFKSDIWSLGCLLYELCTFRSPFNGEESNAYALHKKIGEGRFLPFPSDIYSFQLHFFIKSCLSVKSNDRPSSKEAHNAARRMYLIFEDLLKKYINANSNS